MNHPDLQNKCVVVTAAGSGIGKASALEFARQGSSVVVNDIDQSAADETVQQITEQGGDSITAIADVTDPIQVQKLFDVATTKYDNIDVMYCNAGGALPTPFADASMDMHLQVMALNFTSVLYCAHMVLPLMLKKGGGVILTTSSGAGLGAVNGLSTYGAAKAACNSLVGSLAAEYGKQGIRAVSISAGAMDTPGLRKWADTLPEGFDGFCAKQPVGRIGTPQDIANAAVFLASEKADFINGITVPVDGAVQALLAAPA